MPSGCIMGTCPVCNEHVWEDEWDMVGDIIVHADCKVNYKRSVSEAIKDLEEKYGTKELEAAFIQWYAAMRRKKVEGGGTDAGQTTSNNEN
jgi:hypothetical protein